MPQLLSLCLILFLTHLGQVACLNDEGYALLSFKQSITEDPNGALKNWNSSDDNPCMWNGVTCNNFRVTSLAIPMSGVKGFIPSALGSLTQLRRVNLRSNKLFGTVPLELFEAQSLQNLVLSENFLSGSLPFEIGKLQNIHTLDLSHNYFNASLPQSLIQCRGLRRLILSRNKFTGSLPELFGADLVMLEMLDLSYNNFSGMIPDVMGNLSRLEGTLDLSHNEFTGLIPASLGNLPEKVYIDLSYNKLSGPIPQDGPLANRGPTAFIGNPGLCGPPLKDPCSADTPGVSSAPFPRLPKTIPSQTSHDYGGKGTGLRKSYVIAIVVCNVIGICLIGLLLSCCYYGVCCVKRGKMDNVVDKEMKRSKECLCFRNDESGPLSETGEQSDLVLLDMDARFDLDELLKASAFVLGKNGIGIMYKVVLEDGLTLAVRRLGEGGYQRFKEFQTEVEAIGKIRHHNIVTLKAYYWSVDEKLLIYDYIPNGSLATAIHCKAGLLSSIHLSWPDRLKIIKGTAKGLTFLHEFSPKKYVHGDVKPSNILLGHNMESKISGFGLGRLANIALGSMTPQSIRMPSEKPQHRRLGSALSEPIEVHSTANIMSCYQAPESFKAVKPSQKWDVYSFGVICLELLTGRSALVKAGNSEMDLVHWVLSCIEEKKPLAIVLDPYLAHEVVDEVHIMECIKLSMACVHSNPEKRPAMRHVLDTLNRLVPSCE